MLSQPFQNSDMFHRTETVSDLRSAQAQRDSAAQGHAETAQRRKEEIRESVVEETKQVEHDPNQLSQRERQRRERKKAKGQKNGASEPEADSGSKSVPHRNLGAGHIDLTA